MNAGAYTLTVSNQCNSASATVNINWIPMTAAAISPGFRDTICDGDTLTLTASGGSSYTWSTGETTPAIRVFQAGSYTVQVTGACNASSAIARVYTIPKQMDALLPVQTAFCQGDSVQLTAAFSGNNYLWSTGQTSSSVYVHQSGNYILTITYACGTVSDSITEQVNPLPQAHITTNDPLSFCAGDSALLLANGLGSFTWNTGSHSDSLIAYTTGSFILTSVNGCGIARDTATVTQINAPVAVFLNTTGYICSGHPLTLVAAGGTTYLWPDGSTDSTFNTDSAGTYLIEVSNQCGSDTASISLKESDLKAYFVADTTEGQYPLTVTFTDSSTHAATWSWQFSNGHRAFTANSIQEFLDEGIYVVTLTAGDGLGCYDTWSDTILVHNDLRLFVPNAFSPNADSKNDVFDISGNEIADYTIALYNRWGTQVYAWKKGEPGWDGQYKGVKAPEGLYVYRAEVLFSNGEERKLNWVVTLIK